MKVKVLPGGMPLYKKHYTDAGWDVRTPKDFYLFPKESILLPLGIAVAMEPGRAGFLVNRSSMAAKHIILSNFGVIDAGYRGELKAFLINLGEDIQRFEAGDRIVQLLDVPVELKDPQYVEEFAQATERGEGGFGSTGGR